MPDESKDVISLATKRFQLAAEAEGPWRKEALVDIKFHAGTHGDQSYQWPDSYQSARATDGRPCHTINRLPSFTSQVINQQRLANQTIQINPVDEGADEETAEALTGVLRHIQTAGYADVEVARDTAFANSVYCGQGYYRFRTDYVQAGSWQQEILCDYIRNPLTVYRDPMARRPDKRDMTFAFLVQDFDKDDYDRLYPDSAVASMTNFQSVGDEMRTQWFPNGAVRVAEYYELIETRKKVSPPHGGPAVWRSDFQVIWRQINAVEVLDTRPIPGTRIPVIPIIASELDIDGKTDFKGMIRDGREPQRLFNVWFTAVTEQIMTGSKSPWLVDAKAIEGFEAIWRNANKANYAFLPYHSRDPKTQRQLERPVRDTAEPPIEAMVQALGLADNALKSVMQLYDASLGQRGPEQSGRAILARKEQGEIGNANYADNFKRALISEGQLLLDWIPIVYEKATLLRIIGKNGQPQQIVLHGGDEEAAQALAARRGIEQIYDASLGRYEVTVSVGPSFVSKRAEAVQNMTELMKVIPPEMAAVTAPRMVKELDFPGAHALSEAMELALPEQLRTKKPNAEGPDAGQLQQQLQVMGEQHQQLVQVVNTLTDELKNEKQKLDSQERMNSENNQTKERIADITAATNRLIAAEKLSSQENLQLLQHKVDTMMADMEHLRTLQQADQGHAHALEQGDQGHQQQLEQGAQAAALAPTPEPAGASA